MGRIHLQGDVSLHVDAFIILQKCTDKMRKRGESISNIPDIDKIPEIRRLIIGTVAHAHLICHRQFPIALVVQTSDNVVVVMNK